MRSRGRDGNLVPPLPPEKGDTKHGRPMDKALFSPQCGKLMVDSTEMSEKKPYGEGSLVTKHSEEVERWFKDSCIGWGSPDF
jgi:hypothetical protein